MAEYYQITTDYFDFDDNTIMDEELDEMYDVMHETNEVIREVLSKDCYKQ